jgi:hypothetical protein
MSGGHGSSRTGEPRRTEGDRNQLMLSVVFRRNPLKSSETLVSYHSITQRHNTENQVTELTDVNMDRFCNHQYHPKLQLVPVVPIRVPFPYQVRHTECLGRCLSGTVATPLSISLMLHIIATPQIFPV